jgi:hypothetical protein
MESSTAMRPAIVLSIILATVLAMLQPLFAQNSPGDADSGRIYAIHWCSECHSIEPATAGTGFAPDFTAIAKLPSTTALSLKVFLRSNHDLMPDFILKLTETDDIVAYILSLKRR